MSERRLNGHLVRVVKDDITMLDVEAFVFDARPDLVLGAGYGGAITVRGGPTIQEQLKGLAPVEVGQAVVTDGGTLKARAIIHAVGPKFQEADEEAKLREATANALARARERGIRQIALPPLGTGFYGMPVDRCARIMVPVIARHLEGPDSVDEVVICVRDTRDLAPFEAALDQAAR